MPVVGVPASWYSPVKGLNHFARAEPDKPSSFRENASALFWKTTYSFPGLARQYPALTNSSEGARVQNSVDAKKSRRCLR